MEHIGTRIKRLRRERDLTQEKLANYLNISFQAVSKWETGVAAPDLSMIVPLAKLLNVTTDEILGATTENVDARKKELEEAFEETWKTGNLKDRYDVCAAAVAEYPGDMKWLTDLAWTEALLSLEIKDNETRIAEQEKAIKRFAQVIEDCNDKEIRMTAIMGIVQYLCGLGRRDEAKKYAELYPKDDKNYYRVMNDVLIGEEKLIHQQEHVNSVLYDFIFAIYWDLIFGHDYGEIELAPDVILKTLEAVFPDRNYLFYHGIVAEAYYEKAAVSTIRGDFDGAMELLKKACYHMEESQKCTFAGNTEVYKYSSPLFDRLTYDSGAEMHSGEGDDVVDFKKRLQIKNVFKPLRDREDFKELVAQKPASHE